MASLPFAIVAITVFAQLYKFAEARRLDTNQIITFTAGCGSILAVLLWLDHPLEPAVFPLLLGVFAGLCNYASAFTFFKVVRHGALSISWTVISLAILCPVLISVIFWGDRLSLFQAAGLVSAVLALVLMGNLELGRISRPRPWAFWLTLSFVASGLETSCYKALAIYGRMEDRAVFLISSYLTVLLLSLVVTLPHLRLRRLEVGIGLLRGASMIAANALVLQAVRELPAQVVFPIYGVGNLVGTVVLSALIWKERIPMKARLGLVPAAASIMLLGRM